MDAPGASLLRSAPNDTPDTIRTLAVALAVAPPAGRNSAERNPAELEGGLPGETIAASNRAGPIIANIVTNLKKHG